LPISGDSWLLPLIISITWMLVANITLRPSRFFLKN